MVKKNKATRRPLSERRALQVSNKDRAVLDKLAGCEAWPIHACLINDNWQENRLVNLSLTRHRPDGGLALASFLVDLSCLGIKNANCQPRITRADFSRMLELMEEAGERHADCPPAQALHIVEFGQAWGASLGFTPHKDTQAARLLFRGIEADPMGLTLEGGVAGRPVYAVGPHDDVEAILNQLHERLGPGGFDVITPDML